MKKQGIITLTIMDENWNINERFANLVDRFGHRSNLVEVQLAEEPTEDEVVEVINDHLDLRSDDLDVDLVSIEKLTGRDEGWVNYTFKIGDGYHFYLTKVEDAGRFIYVR